MTRVFIVRFVLFLYCYGEPASVWGELASTSAQEKGIVGTVLYGYARDMDAIMDLDYPVYALDFVPNAGKALGLGEVNVDIEIDNQLIRPGDFIFAALNGPTVWELDGPCPILNTVLMLFILFISF